MALDFRADQVRTSKLVTSGSTGTNAQLLFYPFSAASDSSGGIDPTKFDTSAIGTDVFLYISGALNSAGVADTGGTTVFGGDTYFSGSINFPSGIISYNDLNSVQPQINFTFTAPDAAAGASVNGAAVNFLVANGVQLNDDTGTGGGWLYFAAGSGGPTNANNGGNGGYAEFDAGNGGQVLVSNTTANGGFGGDVYLDSGQGGSTSGGGSGGYGGGMYLAAGQGGHSIGATGSGSVGGDGGWVQLNAGRGGESLMGRGGVGGTVALFGGNGGQSDNFGSVGPGNGGSINFTAGNSGTGTSGALAGDVNITAGDGTYNSFGSVYIAQGGNVTMLAGLGSEKGSILLGSEATTRRVAVFYSTTTTGTLGSDVFFAVSGSNGSDAGDYLGENSYGYGTPVSVSLHNGHVMISGSMHVHQGLLIGADWFDYNPQIVALTSGTSGDTMNVLTVQKVGYNSNKYRFDWGEFGGASGLPEGTYHRFMASTSSFYQHDAHDEQAYNGTGPQASFQFDVLTPQGVYGYTQPLFRIYAGVSGTTQYPVYNGDFVFGYYAANALFFGPPTSSVPPTVLRGDDVISGTNMQGVPVVLRSGLGTGTGSGSYVAIQAGRRLAVGGTGSHIIKDVGIFWHDGRFQIPGDTNANRPAATSANTGSLYYSTDTQALWFQRNATTWVNLISPAYGRLFIGRYTTTLNTSSNPQTCGQNNWDPTEWGFVSGASGVTFQAILSAQTGSATAFVKLYNATTGAYVEIGGAGVTALSTSQTTATKLLSVNLTGALNFVTGSAQIYEVQIYTSVTSSTTFLGSSELLTSV